MANLLGHYARFLVLLVGFGLISACSNPHQAIAAPYAAHVMDARTGETLFSENAETRLHPASLTKMMTLYIAFQEIERGNISLESMITVSANAAAQPPSRLGLKAGQKIALRYLIRAAAVKSANDAASAIGDAISGDTASFAARMTKTAKALGMKNTTFKNANGLTAKGHLSTTQDMSILGRRLFYDFPEYYNIFSRRSTDAGLATVNNTNRRFLDAYKGADGIKTGYTDAAGFNLTASAERDGVRIIATVFGAKSTADRNAKVAKLLDLGFAKAPHGAQTNVPAAPVLEGADDETLVSQLDESLPEVEGGAGKTLRVAMNPARSLLPVARPTLEDVNAAGEMVAALQPGIEDALAQATAAPGTLEFQAAALTTDPAAADLALSAVGQTPAEEIGAAVEAGLSDLISSSAEAVTMAAADTSSVDTAGIAAALAEAGVDLASLGQEPEPPRVLTITASAPAQPLQLAAAARPPKRNKPIYDNPQAAAETALDTTAEPGLAVAALPEPAETTAGDGLDDLVEVAAVTAEPAPAVEAVEVITSVSTSGGRQFGINVGRFGSSYEAERAILQVQLRESATLATGLRKVVQKKGGFEANVMGLTEQEASLACRKLVARQVECQTIGS